jgi:VWFA-related protein
MMISSRIALSLMMLWFGVGSVYSQSNAAKDIREDAAPYTISLHVDWVILPVTVLDRKGGIVSSLDRTDFAVYEDGRAQEIRLFRHEDVPLTLGLVVDNSGSMRSKRSQVVTAVLALVRSLNPNDEVFIVNFNDTAKLGLQSATGFTNSQDEVRFALTRQVPIGRTALYDAIAVALDQLKQGHQDKRVLLLISDGGDNASHLQLDEVLRRAKESRAAFYAISLADPEGREQNPKLLKRLAKVSGGEFYDPSSPAEIEAVCQRISRDLRHQYTLGYVPENQTRDGAFGRIQVKLNVSSAKAYSVRSREGYLAPPAGEKAAVEQTN